MDFQNHGEVMDSQVFQFSRKSVRQGFLKKVYAILSVQLAITAAVIFAFISIPALRLFVLRWYDVFTFTSTFGVLGVVLFLNFVKEARRSWPTNIICLISFTLFEAILLGSFSSLYETECVLMAVFLTALVTGLLTLIAFHTKVDFTVWQTGLLLSLFAFIIFNLYSIFIPSSNMPWFITGISLFGVVIFGMYLVYDTQRMMDGRHQFTISPEEYIFASLNLYLDVANIFLELLNLTGRRRRDE